LVRRSVLALLLLSLVVMMAACGQAGAQEPSAPPATPVPDISKPDGVAQAFLEAWNKGDYAGMYSLLSSNSQAQYSLEAFTQVYTNASDTMMLLNLEAAPQSVLEQGTSGQVLFKVTYQTQVCGDITQDITMNLIHDGQRWGIVWSPVLIFPALANNNDLVMRGEVPSRANIYDRNGKGLVISDASAVTISVVPGELSEGLEDQMVELLAEILRLSPDQVRQQYQGQPDDWLVAIGDTDAEIVQQYYDELNSYPGLYLNEKTGRRYFNVLAPHVVGYTGYIPQDELDEWTAKGYQGDELVGRLGIERWGEEYLAGKRGCELTAWTPGGDFVATIASVEPQPAQSVYTTLDRDLQAAVQDAIREAYGYSLANGTWATQAGGAAVVVVDVHTGEVLAMASYPAYDPNVLNPFNQHPQATQDYFAQLNSDPLRPLLNRATQGQYPAGSTFKVVSMAAALGEGGYSIYTPYTCTGVWYGLGRANPKVCWLQRGHGTISLAQALTFSCDTYFYQLGYNLGNIDFDMIPRYAMEFGFGKETGIQIDEESGLIPTTDWMRATYGREWTISDSVNVAIGQGDVLITPLQMAMAYAAIANGGDLMRPQLVHHIALIGEEPTWTFEPEVVGHLPISDENLAVMQQSLHGVTTDENGTASWRFVGAAFESAGKTGTAQAPGERAQPHAWFAGYAPADDPQIAIAVLIENGGQGSYQAAPIFRRVAEAYLTGTWSPYPADWGNPELYEFVEPGTGEPLGE
jgi:penicillin-binding protein 2